MIDRRSALRSFVMTGAGLGIGFPSSPRAAPDPYLQYVDPEFRSAADMILRQAAGQSQLSIATLAARRGADLTPTFRTDVPVEHRMVPVAAGEPEVGIYVINARPGARRPAIVHMHGGGFVTGRAKESVPGLQALCAELGIMAVTVDYRLAPETTCRGSMEDTYAALRWLHGNARSLGGDPDRIAVMGESAGGGHAALLAITARDRREVPVAFQCLTYPMLDDRTAIMRAVPAHVGRIIWTKQDNFFGWRSFLGREPGSASASEEGVPARTRSLAGLPPAFIGVGALDLFHDEDVDYARRLNDAAVPTELIVVPGAFHVFDLVGLAIPGARIAPWFDGARKDALRRALALEGL